MWAESCEKHADAAFFRVPVAQSGAFTGRDGKLRTGIVALDREGEPSSHWNILSYLHVE